MLESERNDDRLFVGGGLQFEAEPAAEPLAQGQSPGAVDAAAERCVQHELHAAAFVEEPLGDDPLLRRHGAKHAAAFGEILGDLQRRLGDKPEIALERRGVGIRFAHVGDLGRQLGRARGPFAEPERDRRRLPLGIGHAHHAALDLQNPPRRVAELKDIADVGFDRRNLRSACRRMCRPAAGGPDNRRRQESPRRR